MFCAQRAKFVSSFLILSSAFPGHTFTSRFAPGIQICSGRGRAAALQSIAFSTMARIRANHQLARAMRPSRPAAARGGRPPNPSSSCLSVAFIVVIFNLSCATF